MPRANPDVIFTIGHSTHPPDEFIDILQSHHVKAIADVRRFPGSRRLPWFNAAELSRTLPKHGVEYWPFPSLGGRRRSVPDSPNTGWRNASFRGYADYMQTPPFTEALEELITQARNIPTGIMCAEAVPWRCHRSLIADALLVRGWEVRDIYDARKVSPHKMTPFAMATGTRIVYADPAQTKTSLFSTDP